jgi:Ca2+-binding EF-hand superfamily protein
MTAQDSSVQKRLRASSTIPLAMTLLLGMACGSEPAGEQRDAAAASADPTIRPSGASRNALGSEAGGGAGEPAPAPRTPGIPAFQDHDDDRDGKLDSGEFGAWIEEDGVLASWIYEAGGELDRSAVARRVARFWDADQDSVVSEAEWSAGLPLWYGPDDPGTFTDWDGDGDGELDTDEVAEAMEVQGMYSRVDHNQDTLVDKGELAAWLFAVIDTSDDERIDADEWRTAVEYGWVG